ncbi:MAG TPA: DUF3037 domain-containing protein [Candidatus Sulfotelmatobacter sp.]|jgi:hypothetical protein|nr:DUF3037 domain-containing protein [Candidatus Sulfotelmatobacter sp.]
MDGRRQLEFFLLRYVPDAVKDEFVNIGLVMIEAGANGAGADTNVFADVRFTRDWRRVRCLDPQADVEMLAALEREIRGQLRDVLDRAVLLRRLEDSFSNVIQLSPAKGCLAEDPVREIEAMASIYLETAKVGGKREVSGRQRILGKMREAFERAGVAKLLAPVPAAPYTKPGDPFQFDFGYRVKGEIKLFQAVSLKAGVDSAVLLAARYPRIAPVMSKMTETAPVLTAVIDDDLDRGQESVQFALNMMEEERIRIAVAAEMPMLAEVARRELRA